MFTVRQYATLRKLNRPLGLACVRGEQTAALVELNTLGEQAIKVAAQPRVTEVHVSTVSVLSRLWCLTQFSDHGRYRQ